MHQTRTTVGHTAVSRVDSEMSSMLQADYQSAGLLQPLAKRSEGEYARASPAAPVIKTCLGSDDITSWFLSSTEALATATTACEACERTCRTVPDKRGQCCCEEDDMSRHSDFFGHAVTTAYWHAVGFAQVFSMCASKRLSQDRLLLNRKHAKTLQCQLLRQHGKYDNVY